jgi:hypothetical protein
LLTFEDAHFIINYTSLFIKIMTDETKQSEEISTPGSNTISEQVHELLAQNITQIAERVLSN